jgi:VWFA-related protein
VSHRKIRKIGYIAVLACLSRVQSVPAQNAPAQATGEVASQGVPITFQSKVNLVLVPVVVRDKAGKPVGTLSKEDFQLFDKGKPQVISRFSVEKPGAKPIAAVPPLTIPLEKLPGETPAAPSATDVLAPDHFTAWLFDDIHLSFGDLANARQAAEKYLQASPDPAYRTAIFTTSGQTTADFTDDADQLRAALAQLRPRPVSRSTVQECPDVSYYMADLIVNKNDTMALNAAAQEAYVCSNMSPPQTVKDAIPYAQSAAQRALNEGEHETRIALESLNILVRRMGAMPGQRVIVMFSPGFQRLNEQIQNESDVIDRAIKANITINTLDARGLYTDMPDISKRTYSTQALIAKQQYDRDAARAAADLMAELAGATGGSFFENNNDLAKGVKELSSAPEVYYVLGFSPQNLKLDGAYHALKVTLREPAGLLAKARRGYYAPRHLSDADEEAKEEISRALFSREEMHDIPADVHTQFFKSSATEARLVLVTRLDVRKLRYRKADGRNNNVVLVVSGLFDRNGNFLQSVSKMLTMRLKDETLAGKLDAGIALRAEFKVAPGKYVLRLVVRDAEGQMMAAQNGAVEIP